MLPLARPAAADQISNDKAKAAQIEAEVEATNARIDALGQQFDAAKTKVQGLDQQITATRAQIDTDHHEVDHDRSTLQKAAIENYVTDGQAMNANPLFASNQKTLADSQEYTQVAEGDISTAVDNLKTAQNQLNQQQSQLQTQQQAATAAENAAANAQSQAQAQVAQQRAALSQANAQVQSDIHAQEVAAAQAAQAAAERQIAAAKAAQAAAAAAAAAAAQSNGGGNGNGGGGGNDGGAGVYIPPPPSAGGAGAAAVAAAKSQLGVPYVWGAEDPGVGFDCSGLTAWAWGQAGVPLPHYSGAQMADSTPVPISDLEPGDLLFYGPGGSDHVAMYIGGGEMIEAPHTGAVVWITGVRLGGGFAGAGRP